MAVKIKKGDRKLKIKSHVPDRPEYLIGSKEVSKDTGWTETLKQDDVTPYEINEELTDLKIEQLNTNRYSFLKKLGRPNYFLLSLS